jgi:hypothetical protein
MIGFDGGAATGLGAGFAADFSAFALCHANFSCSDIGLSLAGAGAIFWGLVCFVLFGDRQVKKPKKKVPLDVHDHVGATSAISLRLAMMARSSDILVCTQPHPVGYPRVH